MERGTQIGEDGWESVGLDQGAVPAQAVSVLCRTSPSRNIPRTGRKRSFT